MKDKCKDENVFSMKDNSEGYETTAIPNHVIMSDSCFVLNLLFLFCLPRYKICSDQKCPDLKHHLVVAYTTRSRNRSVGLLVTEMLTHKDPPQQLQLRLRSRIERF